MPRLTGAMVLDLPLDLWLWVGFSLLVTTGLGFATGLWYARHHFANRFRRPWKNDGMLVDAVIEEWNAARHACQLLEETQNAQPAEEQWRKLDRCRQQLTETLDELAARSRAATVASTGTPALPSFQILWERKFSQATIGLPGRDALDFNLQALLEAGSAAHVESGLLRIKLDKFPQLQERFGPPAAEHLLRQLARVVLRAAREGDLLCHAGGEELALLMPNIDLIAGRRMAAEIRDITRNYRFLIQESGQEVLVTASFGFTICPPGDNAELAWNRAARAIGESERRGRNQLHIAAGHNLAHCACQ